MTLAQASDRVLRLKEAARNGGDWYIAPPSVDEEASTFIVACDPFEGDSWTAYEVTFHWHGWNAAGFVFDISDEEAISPASSSPIDGWVAWDGSDLILAWSWREEYAIGATTLEGASPFDQETEIGAQLEAWASISRAIVFELMK